MTGANVKELKINCRLSELALSLRNNKDEMKKRTTAEANIGQQLR